MRGRWRVSIGMPWSVAIFANAPDCTSGVKPLSSASCGDADNPTIRTRQSRRSP
jgi:hypothetical protein